LFKACERRAIDLAIIHSRALSRDVSEAFMSSRRFQKSNGNSDASTLATPGWHVLAVLSLLMGFASISTDLYLPAMPEMSRSLHSNPGLVELTISGYLIGFSLGQLLWGPISDRYGRRPSIGVGLVLFVIGSAGCALSGSVLTIIGWRVVQAIGACASVALSRAMVRDLYEGNRAAQMLSTVIAVMAIAPLVGPLVGGQILALAGWRAIFLNPGGHRACDAGGTVYDS